MEQSLHNLIKTNKINTSAAKGYNAEKDIFDSEGQTNTVENMPNG